VSDHAERLPDLSADPEIRRASLDHARMLALEIPTFAEKAGCKPSEVERLRRNGALMVRSIEAQLERKMAAWN
jgi:hypothetical protein